MQVNLCSGSIFQLGNAKPRHSPKGSLTHNVSSRQSHSGANAKCILSLSGTTKSLGCCYCVPMKGNSRPGQQQVAGQTPGQQSQTPAKVTKIPKSRISKT
jgi:hypothetical protein